MSRQGYGFHSPVLRAASVILLQGSREKERACQHLRQRRVIDRVVRHLAEQARVHPVRLYGAEQRRVPIGQLSKVRD